ncbi:GNAT family N-acetyltransferase [uncultured Microscilla sp.]|uniref:GNAT family N-acetyltransferase n=1 Tax=uncultured Microscilla sp. TaxID=432653 RepID=UPI002611DA7D|nr:GNAT family N-acetyltransferase [uncultured Microscilla sp.]
MITSKFETPRLILRELSLHDLDSVHELHSLPETDEFNTLGIPRNKQETLNILQQWVAFQRSKTRKNYTLAVEFEQRFVGLVGLHLGTSKMRNGEIWYKIHSNYWGLGIATEAVSEMLRFAFHDLVLHRIEAGCAIENQRSIKVLEKIGMTSEGRKRKALPLKTGWADTWEYAILEDEFNN